MKISIMDLMGHYYGEPVMIDTPQSREITGKAGPECSTVQPKARRFPRPLLVAAALLLIVTAGFTVPFAMSRTAEKYAMSEGTAPTESVMDEQPPELPAAATDSSAEITQDTEQTPEAAAESLIPAHTITGAKVRETYDAGNGYRYGQTLLDENNLFCYGNMVNLDGTYYTLTDSGPKPLETTNLHTTVDLYGSWEVDIDYAVVDGELVFHDNTSTSRYAMIDGEKVTESEYLMKNGRWADDGIEWITPNVATPRPVEGSTDTVMLGIRRIDKAVVDNCYYEFFYNIFTGEISDPLGSVPGLFDHGSYSHAQFNSARTRAILHYFGVAQGRDGENIVDGALAYICDLTTGEMTLLDDLAAPYMPEPESTETTFEVRSDFCFWADDDTLLFSILGRTPNGKEWGVTEDGGVIDTCDNTWWVYSYDMVTGTVNYQRQNIDVTASMNSDFNQPYLMGSPEDGSGYQVFDAAAGTCYWLEETMDWQSGDYTTDRAVRYTGDNEIYLIDAAGKCWVKLSDYMEIPENDKSNDIGTTVKLLNDEWLCLLTEDSVYGYHIPDDLPMTPLTEK